MRLNTLTGLLALAILGACQPNKTGGPCSYETTTVEGTVVGLMRDGIRVDTGAEELAIPKEYVRGSFSLDQSVIVEIENITEGTCTPVMYSVQELSE